MSKVEVKEVKQETYSKSASKELLQKVLNDPKYTIKRWNSAKGEFEEVCPYQVFRTVLKKMIADMKYPNKSEIASIDDLNVRVCNELVELIPELVAAHLDNDVKFALPTTPTFNAILSKKYVPAGEKTSAVRNIKENKVDGSVTSKWEKHYVVRCKSTRPAGLVVKTRHK